MAAPPPIVWTLTIIARGRFFVNSPSTKKSRILRRRSRPRRRLALKVYKVILERKLWAAKIPRPASRRRRGGLAPPGNAAATLAGVPRLFPAKAARRKAQRKPARPAGNRASRPFPIGFFLFVPLAFRGHARSVEQAASDAQPAQPEQPQSLSAVGLQFWA